MVPASGSTVALRCMRLDFPDTFTAGGITPSLRSRGFCNLRPVTKANESSFSKCFGSHEPSYLIRDSRVSLLSMPSRPHSQSLNPEPANQGFTDLFLFLREAFQKKGLISIPPELLQRFKRCPLQDIECPNIAGFARLFEGAQPGNRFRLEANSFIYTVQILFHLRPNLTQERILYLLMGAVRLLKDEKEASSRLSELAGKDVDRYAVARKRATVSHKLVPWLLRHFAQDSTTVRLKIVAAQFLFYLLQGDEEAKKILSSAPQEERWSLGRAISASPELPVRILAANILREALLAHQDLCLFWAPDMIKSNDPPLPSGFIADAKWLHDTVQYLRDIDKGRTISHEGLGKVHETISVRAGSLAFSELASTIPVTVSDQLSFMIPGNQKRPLQILEIPLAPNVQYDIFGGADAFGDRRGGRVHLQLQLRNTGFYKLNGRKGAVDRVDLSFAKNEDCDDFCQDIANSLRKMSKDPSAAHQGHSDVGQDGSTTSPKEQSRAVMIDLSQDAVPGGDTQIRSTRHQIPRKVSTSGPIDVSISTESSVAATSPLGELIERKATPRRQEADAGHMLHRSNLPRDGLDVPNSTETEGSLDRMDNVKVTCDARQEGEGDTWREIPVALANREPETNIGEGPEGRLPQKMHDLDSEETKISSSEANSSHLQHVALETLQHSAKNAITAAPPQQSPVTRSEENHRRIRRGRSRQTASDQPGDSAHQPPSMPAAPANSGKRMALKPKSTQQFASKPLTNPRRQRKTTDSNTSQDSTRRSKAVKAIQANGAAVDWDEDLREDEDEAQDTTRHVKQSKAFLARNSKGASKKPTTTSKSLKGSPSREKGRSKDKTKENKSKAAVASAGLAASRPRRTAAIVSYDEKSDQEDQSQETVHETTEIAGHVQREQAQAEALVPEICSDDFKQMFPRMDEDRPVTAESPFSGTHSRPTPEEATVQIYDSNRLLPAPNLSGHAIDDEPLIPEPLEPREQKGSKTKVDLDTSGDIAQPEVEVVEDSYPMDKEQRISAINAARKSFGSTLTDICDDHGLRMIPSPQTMVPRQTFGDKGVFIASLKNAIEESSSKHTTKIPDPKTKRHVQTPSSLREKGAVIGQGLANDFPQPSPISGRIPPLKPGDQRPDEGGLTILPQDTEDTNPASPERSPSPNQPLTLPPDERRDAHPKQPVEENKRPTGIDLEVNSPNHQGESEKLEPSARAGRSAAKLPQGDRGPSSHPSGRKRGASAASEGPTEAKRPRNTDPDLEMNQQDIGPESQQVVRSKGRGLTPNPHISEPSRSSPDQISHAVESPKTPRTREEPKNPHAVGSHIKDCQITPSRSPLKPIHSTAQTLQLQVEVRHPTILTDDPSLQTRQVVAFIAQDPPDRGVSSWALRGSSSGKRGPGREQSSSGLRDMDKQLAFRDLQADSESANRPRKPVSKPSQLFARDTRRKARFSLFHRKSTDDGVYFEQESADDATPGPMASSLEDCGSVLQTSRVDENGSPRLDIQQAPKIPTQLMDLPAAKPSLDICESVGKPSVLPRSNHGGFEIDESAPFGLEVAVSRSTTAKPYFAAESKNTRSRPSIGVGKLLDDNFPLASKSIRTTAFRDPPLATSTISIPDIGKQKSSEFPGYGRSVNLEHISQALPDPTKTPLFEIERLNVSLAPEEESSAGSGHVRRRRSNTPLSPTGDAVGGVCSPPSFNTRLAKMIMPPPPRKDQSKVETADKLEIAFGKGQEPPAVMDAETTLVNGEAFEYDTDVPSPQRPEMLSSSFSDEEDFEDSTPQQLPPRSVDKDRRFWNQKVAETQQTVLELLEQVSEKILVRFSSAEEGINSKLNHYHYGGRKIVNNLVEQFDGRVTEGKVVPSPRIVQHRIRLQETIDSLQSAKKRVRNGPSLDDLQKSHDRRTDYVLANLEKLADAQQP